MKQVNYSLEKFMIDNTNRPFKFSIYYDLVLKIVILTMLPLNL